MCNKNFCKLFFSSLYSPIPRNLFHTCRRVRGGDEGDRVSLSLCSSHKIWSLAIWQSRSFIGRGGFAGKGCGKVAKRFEYNSSMLFYASTFSQTFYKFFSSSFSSKVPRFWDFLKICVSKYLLLFIILVVLPCQRISCDMNGKIKDFFKASVNIV